MIRTGKTWRDRTIAGLLAIHKTIATKLANIITTTQINLTTDAREITLIIIIISTIKANRNRTIAELETIHDAVTTRLTIIITSAKVYLTTITSHITIVEIEIRARNA